MKNDISLVEYQPGDKERLLKLTRDGNVAQKHVLRAKIVLKTLGGQSE